MGKTHHLGRGVAVWHCGKECFACGGNFRTDLRRVWAVQDKRRDADVDRVLWCRSILERLHQWNVRVVGDGSSFDGDDTHGYTRCVGWGEKHVGSRQRRNGQKGQQCKNVKHGKRNARKNTLEEMLVVSVG